MLVLLTEQVQLTDLLTTAQDAITKFKVFADSDQIDKAYVQYVRASEITINLIPQHPQYRTATSQIPGWHRHFSDLMMASLITRDFFSLGPGAACLPFEFLGSTNEAGYGGFDQAANNRE